MKPRLSVTVITKNEAHNLRGCLGSVAFADEMIVVDCGSTDGTPDIARSLGARVVVTPDWPGFGPQKNRALDLATGEWVLSLDADERVSEALCAEIVAIVAADGAVDHGANAYEMPRLSTYLGRPMRHGDWWPDAQLRLFRRTTGRFTDDIVHERVVIDGPVGRLKSHLEHTTFRTLEDVLDKMNRYSSAGADRMRVAGRRGGLTRAILRGLWKFVSVYLVQGGFLDGREGFICAVSSAEGTYYRYLKLHYNAGGSPP